jgi:SAM-dependent methyltransferase
MVATVANRLRVATRLSPASVDVVHLGDVIEHLTDPYRELQQVLRLLKPGGHLVAQGPLEANPTLFVALLKLSRRLRGSPVAEMPPYHVILATARGQKMFFDRLGLGMLMFSMREVSWPAPVRLTPSDLLQLRRCVMFGVRRLSQALSLMRPTRWGNRYFYVGQFVR